jgi:hypothetical protein
MRRIKVILDFIKLTVAAKISFYRNVIVKLTGNVTFPNPDEPLENARMAVDKLEAAQLAAKDGGHTARSAMHDAEEEADKEFRILAAYVDRIAAGDETTILSSGFHISKQPSIAQKPELSVDKGDNSGSVWLVARAVDKAGAYIWQYAKDTLPATDAEWLTAGHTTQSYFQLTGLTVAAKYYFRIAAITPDGLTDYTTAIMKVVA